MERPLRLIAANPVDSLARTVEALLVVAAQPLSVGDLAEAAGDEAERVETALGLLGDRYREGRSGIVLEQVAGGWAFRASREAAEACGRLFERPVERNLSQAALETLAVVAYMGPCSREPCCATAARGPRRGRGRAPGPARSAGRAPARLALAQRPRERTTQDLVLTAPLRYPRPPPRCDRSREIRAHG